MISGAQSDDPRWDFRVDEMCKLFVYLSTEMLNRRFNHRLHMATLLTTLSARGPYLSEHIFICTSVKLRSKESGYLGLQMAQYLAFHV